MPENAEQDLKRLCDLALELGVSNARAIEVKDMVVDERVRLKCQVPLCDDYGLNLMCPPNVMPVSDFVQTLSRYRFAVLLQLNCPIPQYMLHKKNGY